MTAIEIYNQTKQLPESERKELFKLLRDDLATDGPQKFSNEDELVKLLEDGLASPGRPMTENTLSDVMLEMHKRISANHASNN